MFAKDVNLHRVPVVDKVPCLIFTNMPQWGTCAYSLSLCVCVYVCLCSICTNLKEGKVIGLISQSDVLNFLSKHLELCPSTKLTVNDIWRPADQPLVSVNIKVPSCEDIAEALI